MGTAAVIVALVGAAGAQGAQRYAAPGGSGSACSQATPCSLQEAIGKAGSNDEVIVTSGTYSVSAPIEASSGASNVYIHGDFSAPMPHIAAAVELAPFRFEGPGERYSYLDIVNQAFAAAGLICYGAGSTIERVRALAIGEYAHGAYEASGCMVHDSLLRSEGKYSVALLANGIGAGAETAVARNVTALATGTESFGIEVANISAVGGGPMTLDLKNAIASGDDSDLAAAGTGGPSKLLVTNSNFDSTKPIGEGTITGSPNQTTAPLFVNAAGGDYREAAGSPTIDAGSTDQIGPVDLEGNPRNQGAAPDIGAFEFASPVIPPGQLQSLAVKPGTFRAANIGGAIASRKKALPPVGATVSYSLTAAATASFTVERVSKGRVVGGQCKKKTRLNAGHKKCIALRTETGGFSQTGAAGTNQFKFSGRLGGKALKPGRYRLTASAGDVTQSAAFKIVH
jgi:hypothetical protein